MCEGNHRLGKRAAGSFLIFAVLTMCWIYFASEWKLDRRYPAPIPSVSAPEPIVMASRVRETSRGRHLVTAVAQCQFCHGSDLGGRVIADVPLIGRVDSSNLTRGRGGIANRYTRQDWENAIRYGLRPDRTTLVLMPSKHLVHLTSDDLDAIVDYVLAVPPIDRVPRKRSPGWLSRMLIAFGQVEDVFSAHSGGVEEAQDRSNAGDAPIAELGAYLAEIGNCRVCHRADLRGGLHPMALPGEPEPPALVGAGALQGWTLDDFDAAMRHGTTPQGRVLDRDYMPWPAFAALRDSEIAALWGFLKSDRARTLGSRQ